MKITTAKERKDLTPHNGDQGGLFIDLETNPCSLGRNPNFLYKLHIFLNCLRRPQTTAEISPPTALFDQPVPPVGSVKPVELTGSSALFDLRFRVWLAGAVWSPKIHVRLNFDIISL